MFSCPIPITDYPTVTLAHGGGGHLMHQLIQKMFVQTFDNAFLSQQHDGAVFATEHPRLAFTTDSYVVKPLFFPGGNIGSLAIHGTVNDLAMCGARPLYLSVGLILEEGLPMDTLWRIIQAMKAAAQEAGVKIVTGDTKVVDKGKGDGVYINTSGVGVLEHSLTISPTGICPGDIVLLSGDIGRHGMAIMAVREGLEFESPIESDSAPVADLVCDLLKNEIPIHCLRDLTRGGLASALNEIAETAGLSIQVTESQIPLTEAVQGACEILGFDPLYVANEGRFICFIPPQVQESALAIMQAHPLGKNACAIGQVTAKKSGLVSIESVIGTHRLLEMLSGEQLPRIC